jgi:tetratricopeptide (TPR) repeat protein
MPAMQKCLQKQIHSTKNNNLIRHWSYTLACKKKHPASAILNFNIGNVYFKKGELAMSIASYERAKRFKPTDEDIQHNLLFAKAKTVDKIEKQNHTLGTIVFSQASSFLSSYQWTITSIVCCWLAAGSFMLFLFSAGWKKIGFYLGVVLALCSVLFLGIGKNVFSIENKCNSGVIAVEKVFIKSAPDNNASDLFLLHEGTEVLLLDQVDGYAKIRLDDGKTGWLPQQDILAI